MTVLRRTGTGRGSSGAIAVASAATLWALTVAAVYPVGDSDPSRVDDQPILWEAPYSPTPAEPAQEQNAPLEALLLEQALQCQRRSFRSIFEGG